MNFSIFLENYSKTVWTAITNSSHYVNATDFKTGQMLTEKPCKQNKNYKKLLPLQMYCIIYFLFGWYGNDITQNRFWRHKHYIFHRSLMFLSFYICLHYFFHKHMQHNFYKLGNYLVQNVFQTAWQMVPSEVRALW